MDHRLQRGLGEEVESESGRNHCVRSMQFSSTTVEPNDLRAGYTPVSCALSSPIICTTPCEPFDRDG
jgi:hypothetical protein